MEVWMAVATPLGWHVLLSVCLSLGWSLTLILSRLGRFVLYNKYSAHFGAAAVRLNSWPIDGICIGPQLAVRPAAKKNTTTGRRRRPRANDNPFVLTGFRLPYRARSIRSTARNRFQFGARAVCIWLGKTEAGFGKAENRYSNRPTTAFKRQMGRDGVFFID